LSVRKFPEISYGRQEVIGKMWVEALVRKHINCLPDDAIFCTRDFLTYGRRSAVDVALWRLVRKDVIIRLAWGVFVKNVRSVAASPPSREQVVEAKLNAFARENRAAWRSHKSTDTSVPEEDSAKNRRSDCASTSFRLLKPVPNSQQCNYNIALAERAQIRSRAPRKLLLDGSVHGEAIIALWSLGRKVCEKEHVADVRQTLERKDRDKFDLSMRWMPWWLSNLIHELKRYQYVNMVGRRLFEKTTKRLVT